MTIQNILWAILCLSQGVLFYSVMKLDNKITLLIEIFSRNQERANEYLKVIAEQHGYR
jgi:hypothetical protein